MVSGDYYYDRIEGDIPLRSIIAADRDRILAVILAARATQLAAPAAAN